MALAVQGDGPRILILIEWKYAEKYGKDDKSKGAGGETRKSRHLGLIGKSELLKA